MHSARKTGLALIVAGIAAPAALLAFVSGYTPGLGLMWNLDNVEVVLYDELTKHYMDIAEFRERYPMYADLSDEEVTERLHQKYFALMPLEEYRRAFLSSAPSGPRAGGGSSDILGIRGKIESLDGLSPLTQVIITMDAAEYGLYDVTRKRLAFHFKYSLIIGLVLTAAGIFLVASGAPRRS